MTFFLFIVRLVEVQYKAAPGVLHSLKKVKKPKNDPKEEMKRQCKKSGC